MTRKDLIRRLLLYIVCSRGGPVSIDEVENEVKQRCWKMYSRWLKPRTVIKSILSRLVLEGLLIEDENETYTCIAPKRIRWDYPPRCE